MNSTATLRIAALALASLVTGAMLERVDALAYDQHAAVQQARSTAAAAATAAASQAAQPRS